MRLSRKSTTSAGLLTRSWSWIAFGLAVIVVSGCSRSHELETAKVSGKVFLDGKPMTQGTVMFVPEMGRAGSGVIGSDGSYRLTTYRDADGALVGRHKISVTIPEGNEIRSARIAVAIPRRYMSAESSGLAFDVKAGEENQVDLQLTSTSP